MSIPSNENIAESIRAGLTKADVKVTGDGHHFETKIVCSDFAGKTRVARHQMVYAALGDRMRAEIHALSIQALTPEEDK